MHPSAPRTAPPAAFPALRFLKAAACPVIAAILALSGAAQGQPVERAQNQPDNLARPARDMHAVVELAPEAVRLESVALSFYPPSHASVQTTSIGGQATIEVIDKDVGWELLVKAPRSTNANLTAADVTNAALTDLLGASGLVFDSEKGVSHNDIKDIWKNNQVGSIKEVTGFKGYNGLVQDRNKAVAFPNFPEPAEQFFISIPSKNTEPIIRGFTAIRTAPGQFITFELVTRQSQFARAKEVYTVLLSAAKVGDPRAIAQDRAAAIGAGVALFERLTPEDLEAVLANYGERWERRYRPAPTRDPGDAVELGYRRIKAWKGKRGELNPTADIKRYNIAESQDGYLVRLDARIIENKQIIDSRSLFFVSTDRSEEAWSVSLGVQGLDHTGKAAYTETGARNGRSMTVTTSGAGNGGVTSRPVIEGAGYISRVEAYLLPQILIRAGLAGDYGFYVFQSDTGSIKLRRDSFSQPSDRPDSWQLDTRLSEDGKLQIANYTAAATLISSQLPDGTIWEPINQDKLIKLWRTKGMPMD